MLPLFVTASLAQDPSGGLAKTPPMGWMSWQAFRCEVDCAKHPHSCINEDLYKSTALAMKEGGYVEAGYVGVHIDDCWEGTTPPTMLPVRHEPFLSRSRIALKQQETSCFLSLASHSSS